MMFRHSCVAAVTAAALVSLLSAQAPPRNSSLVGRFDPSGQSYNDIWGYVSPAGKEYAILGTGTGTYIVDCSDPTNPIQRGFFSGPNSGWRDMRTYQHYAYVVTEGGGGVQIIDLQDPDKPVLVKTWGTNVFRRAHNVALDTGAGMLYPCGTDVGVPIISLADPVNPVHLGNMGGSYVHDLHVRDGIAHLAQINNSRYELRDVTQAPATTVLGSVSFSSAHHIWPSRDNTVASVAAESFNPGVAIVDISNKRLPTRVAVYKTGSNSASAHNAFIRDRVVHIAYYSEGYRAVDISDPRRPVEVAHYDTTSSTSGFSGSWGCYPFQPSGVVYMSDRNNGLMILDSKATPDLFGIATDGAAGAPEIYSFGAAFAGNANFAVELDNAPANASVVLLLGAASGNTAVAGVQLAVDLSQPVIAVTAQTDAAGTVRVPIAVPPGDATSGVVYAQFVVTDPGAAAGLAATRGMRFDVFSG